MVLPSARSGTLGSRSARSAAALPPPLHPPPPATVACFRFLRLLQSRREGVHGRHRLLPCAPTRRAYLLAMEFGGRPPHPKPLPRRVGELGLVDALSQEKFAIMTL
jgi:hypothetical protein